MEMSYVNVNLEELKVAEQKFLKECGNEFNADNVTAVVEEIKTLKNITSGMNNSDFLKYMINQIIRNK